MNYYFTGIDDNYLLKGPPGVQLTDGMLTWTLPQSISTGRYEIELVDKINDNASPIVMDIYVVESLPIVGRLTAIGFQVTERDSPFFGFIFRNKENSNYAIFEVSEDLLPRTEPGLQVLSPGFYNRSKEDVDVLIPVNWFPDGNADFTKVAIGYYNNNIHEAHGWSIVPSWESEEIDGVMYHNYSLVSGGSLHAIADYTM